MTDPDAPPPADRRGFLKFLALAGVSSMVSAAPSLRAQTTPRAGATPGVPPDSASAPPKEPEISEDAKALTEIVRRRYGQHLAPAQLEAVTREIDQRLQGGKRLRDSKLANGDEPEFVFKA